MTVRILTTHTERNPLIGALRAEGVDAVSVRRQDAVRALQAGEFSAFYGNFFDEIKYLPTLFALKRVLIQRGIPYVFWNRDAPWNVGMKLHNRLLAQWWKPIDIYLSHSMQEAGWFSRSCHFFPNAAQSAYYTSTRIEDLRSEASYQQDVAFFGALGNLRRRGCRERVAFLAAVEAKVRHVLPQVRFRVVDTIAHPMGLAEQLALIRTSKVNLNFGAMCDLPGNPSWGLPERVFGIPAAGGYLLTDYRRSIDMAFPNATSDSFIDAEDCASKIVHGLSSFPWLRERAEALHREVMAAHTYAERVKRLLSLIEAYPAGVTISR